MFHSSTTSRRRFGKSCTMLQWITGHELHRLKTSPWNATGQLIVSPAKCRCEILSREIRPTHSVRFRGFAVHGGFTGSHSSFFTLLTLNICLAMLCPAWLLWRQCDVDNGCRIGAWCDPGEDRDALRQAEISQAAAGVCNNKGRWIPSPPWGPPCWNLMR